ncbi:hypothetical protein BC629DRAFT_1479355 [Irpex lacteus]|nr:hypothetical protein BC629DRAFT_1479355 [Irpex lacteus]
MREWKTVLGALPGVVGWTAAGFNGPRCLIPSTLRLASSDGGRRQPLGGEGGHGPYPSSGLFVDRGTKYFLSFFVIFVCGRAACQWRKGKRRVGCPGADLFVVLGISTSLGL